MANTYLTRTLGSGNKDKWTWSAWVKKHSNGSILPLFHADDGSTNYYTHISFHDTDQLFFQNRYANTNKGYKISTQVFRDNNAWYHVQFVWDSDNSTADDRQIIYVNGERITGFDTNVAVTADQNTTINDGYEHRIGRGGTGFNGSAYANVTLSHVHFADGQALAPTVFGSTDNVTGEWKINTSPSFTPGTNGFTILKDGNTITDQSSNSNNWTLGGGTLTNLVDNPSNVFATMNPLDNLYFSGTFTNGNNTVVSGTNSYSYCSSTIHVSSGKYYWEIKAISPSSAMRVGIGSKIATSNSDNLGNDTDGEAVIYPSGAIKVNNVDDPNSWSGTSWTTNDILGFAMDLDNNKLYISKNGVFMNSGNPTSGSTGTGAISITAPASTPTGNYFVAWGDNWSSGTATMSHNFGNGFFGTTAISSEGTNASGIGKFEYDVPAGYTALSTKGLNS